MKKIDEVLFELRKKREEFWNIGDETAKLFRILILMMKPVRIFEVGTSNGFSSLWFLRCLIEFGCDAEIVTIESHKGRFELAGKNFEKAGVAKKIKQIKGHAPSVLSEVFEECYGSQMIFLDGVKSSYKGCLQFFKDKLKVGDMILVDNVISHREKLEEFWIYLESLRFEYFVEILNVDKGVAVLVKKNFQKS